MGLNFGGSIFGEKGEKKKGKYQPSFIAQVLNIKASKAQALKAEKTGFGIRGIISRITKRGR